MTEPTHQVIVHRLAMSDLEFAYTYVWKTGGTQASAWYKRFIEHLQSLRLKPERCPISRESSRVFFETRELLFGRRQYVFRVLFTIDGESVRILRIVRAQRRSPSWRSIEDSYFLE